jgi:hypothetical protein
VVKWNNILYTLVNITGLQFFGREDPAVDEFFDINNFQIDAPLKTNERSLRVTIEFYSYFHIPFFCRHQPHLFMMQFIFLLEH